MKKKLYFAGELFDHKHLIGNHLLANALEEQSDDIDVLLPQKFEQTTNRALDVRNQDYKLLLCSDLAIFNFDGVDADSGTVAEFMFAKALDIPSVILRTDFRSAGDGLKDGDPWNLMMSGFPRTLSVVANSMGIYQLNCNAADPIEAIYSYYASAILESFEHLKSHPKVFESNVLSVYKFSCLSLGEGFVKFLLKDYPGRSLEEALDEILEDKFKKGTH